MKPEEILKKHIEGPDSIENSKLMAAASLVTANTTKELADANLLVAKTTQASAELLAKTTQASAELLAKTTEASAKLLAKTTQASAEQLNVAAIITEKRMKWLTIALIAVGVIQIAIAIIALSNDLWR